MESVESLESPLRCKGFSVSKNMESGQKYGVRGKIWSQGSQVWFKFKWLTNIP